MKRLDHTDNMMPLIPKTGSLPATLNDVGMNGLPNWHALRKRFAAFARICQPL
jgi:hypothetical protein